MIQSAHKTSPSNRTITMRFSPSSFTGKERDEETGYGYFGARYMDHELMTMWLSVDPMADKYPSISPYAYCAWNPEKLTDPDGEFPRLPYLARVATSKHVYSAIAYKVKYGGSLEVWEHPSGCIFASVQFNNAGIDESGAVMIEAKMFRPDGYTSESQIKVTTDFFVKAESWMDEHASNIADFGLKTVAKIGYSMANEPTKLLTGCSLAGTEATPIEMEEAFVGVAAGSLGSTLSKGMGTIKTAGKTGLGQYNDFVRRMGNYQGRSKKEMGQLYQTNKELNRAVSSYRNFEKGVAGTSVFRKED